MYSKPSLSSSSTGRGTGFDDGAAEEPPAVDADPPAESAGGVSRSRDTGRLGNSPNLPALIGGEVEGAGVGPGDGGLIEAPPGAAAGITTGFDPRSNEIQISCRSDEEHATYLC